LLPKFRTNNVCLVIRAKFARITKTKAVRHFVRPNFGRRSGPESRANFYRITCCRQCCSQSHLSAVILTNFARITKKRRYVTLFVRTSGEVRGPNHGRTSTESSAWRVPTELPPTFARSSAELLPKFGLTCATPFHTAPDSMKYFCTLNNMPILGGPQTHTHHPLLQKWQYPCNGSPWTWEASSGSW